MGAHALPQDVDAEARETQHADGNGRRVGPNELRTRLAPADLAQRPGQGRKRGGNEACTEDIELARLLKVDWRGEPKQGDRDDRKRRIDPEYRLPSETVGQPAAEHRTCGGRQGRR